MIKKVGVAFLGLGTVGEEVFKQIKENPIFRGDKYNVEFEIREIFVRDINKKRNVDLSGISITTNFEEIIKSPNIQICIECMGGEGADRTIEMIEAAIRNGKHIVMSSKKCLALNMNHIVYLANYYNVQLRFEATVGGAIPICHTLMNMSKENRVNKMYGVINATTNYVLSLVEKNHVNFEEALEIARKKRITENDSSEDIDGWDAVYKMKILTGIGMKLDMNCEELHPVSMDTQEMLTVNTSSKCKQIFYVERSENNEISYYVGPAVIDKYNMMYNVNENNNIIYVDSRFSGIRAYFGKGAGGKETASVMYEDLIDIYRQCYWLELSDVAMVKKLNAKEIIVLQ